MKISWEIYAKLLVSKVNMHNLILGFIIITVNLLLYIPFESVTIYTIRIWKGSKNGKL